MPAIAQPLTEAEVAYIGTQTLGRLATVDPKNAPQNNPVGFRYNAETGTVDIGGHNLGKSRKFHNIESNADVSLVIDDIASTSPWVVRMVEIRGTAQALRDVEPISRGMSREMIRIYPRRVISFGLDGKPPHFE